MNFTDYRRALAAFYTDCGVELRLHEPAPRGAVDGAEQVLGFPLDVDLRSAWLSANGSPPWEIVFSNPGYESSHTFLSVDEALAHRQDMEARAPQYSGYVQEAARSNKIRDGWFQTGWLPFANFGGGTLMLLQDYSPSAEGHVGQIISFTHDPDSIDYIAPSFSAFLEASLADLLQSDPDDLLSGLDR